MRGLPAVLLFALTAALPAQRAITALPETAASDLLARVVPDVEAFRKENGVPGVGGAVRLADGTMAAFGLGIADVENDVPVTEHTVFRLASISKPFTAVAALRLVERGELDLDRPVHEIVDAWPEKKWPVTCRLLMGHLGGVRHYRGIEILSNLRYPTVTDAIGIFAADPLEYEPGTKYRYTTYGYNLLGAAVVAAAEKPFAELLRAEVLEPAGCTTLCLDDSAAIVPHRAQGYRRIGGELKNSHPVDTSNKIPGGGLCGTPTDLVRFAGAILGGRLLKPETVDAMWTSMTTKDGESTGYGMGWNVREHDGHRIALHGGAQPRVSTLLWIDRDTRTAVALMANLEGVGRSLRALAPRVAASAVDDR